MALLGVYVVTVTSAGTARVWVKSLPALETVIGLIQEHYGLQPAHAVLVRSFNNDVYRIDTAERSYALKIYGVDRWTTDEVRWEQQLVRHVLNSGLAVAADVALVGGDTVGSCALPRENGPSRWPSGYRVRSHSRRGLTTSTAPWVRRSHASTRPPTPSRPPTRDIR